jgi:hypothetical protein
MRDVPLVSIIIPTYNNKEWISQAINCSLDQTYSKKEIIVVDDGSDDGTEKLIKQKYGESVLYFKQKNKGPGSARNTGIRHASGQYLQFIDADDFIFPEKIEIQVDSLKNFSERSISYCKYKICDEQLNEIRQDQTKTFLGEGNQLENLILRWETEISIPIHCFLFNMEFFKKNKIKFDEKLPANEDWQCWIEIFSLRPNVVFVNKPLAYYRVRTNSRCRNRGKMRKSALKVIKNQAKKNQTNHNLLCVLKQKKKLIKYNYKEEAPFMKLLNSFPPIFKKIYNSKVPWRIQRLLD